MAECSESESTRISNRIEAVLEAVAERIHYAEGRRSSYVTMAGVFIAASIAVFTFAFGAIEQEWLRWAGVFSAISMFLVGGGTVWIYGRQTNRYPWTDVTKAWKWFYRDALPAANKFSMPWTSYFDCGWKKIKANSQDQYKHQLNPFKDRIKRLANDKTNLEQDMEQLYVLHINELYKNFHLSSIRTFFNRGIIIVLISLVLGALFGFCLNLCALQPREFVSNSLNFREVVKVRLLNSPLLDQSQFSAELFIANKGKTPIIINKIVARDASGWLIPITLTSDPLNITIAPSASSTTYFTYEIPTVLINKIKNFQILKR